MAAQSRTCDILLWMFAAIVSFSLANGLQTPRVMAVTETPYSATTSGARFSCLVSEHESMNSSLEIRRYVRQGPDITQYTLDLPPGSIMQETSEQVRRVNLPASTGAQGTYSCRLLKDGIHQDVAISMLHIERRLQAQGGRSTVVANTGDRVFLRCETLAQDAQLVGLVWTRMSDFVTVGQQSLAHLISSATSADSDVYGCYYNGLLSEAKLGVVRLIVRDCPAGKWSPPLCNNVCDFCYNGGICDDKTGECVCAPGFTGQNCLNICDDGFFGWNCEFQCGSGATLQVCDGSHLCMPDPYGCSCAAGYTGTYCMQACSSGAFGAGCTQECHCAIGECRPHSGECLNTTEGCAEGWDGTNCQVPKVCPFGYYGRNCTDKCQCENDSPCDKTTGYCSSTDGSCAPGYLSSIGVNLQNCQHFIGCHSQCSRTCHCSGGVDDCVSDADDISTNGMCLSEMCSDAWLGPHCDSGITDQSAGRANPGQEFTVTCTVINLSLQPTNIPDTVHLVLGSPVNATATYQPASATTKFFSMHRRFFGYGKVEFLVSGVEPTDRLFCVHEVDSNMAVTEVLFNLFVLPKLGSSPALMEANDTWIEVAWMAWNSSEGDTGEGPIVAYSVYINGSEGWEVQATLPHDQELEVYSWNVTDLVYGLTYKIAVSVSREGMGGEGEMSEALTVTLGSIIADTDDMTPGDQSSPAPLSTSLIVFILLCILALILLITCILLFTLRKRGGSMKRRKSFDLAGFGVGGEGSLALPTSPQEAPEPLDEPDTVVSPPNDDNTIEIPTTKPIAAVKPSVKEPQYAPVPANRFPEYFWDSLENGLLEEQFKALPEDLTQPCLVARREEHKQRNRYRNILAYDHNRVVLEDGDDPVHGYINASYIKGYNRDQQYIASQGPNTASVIDFWKMIWQEDIGKIVMATNLYEERKNKCFKYWPEVGEIALEFGPILVTNEDEETLDSCVRRQLTATMDGETKNIVQFHYTEWPDKDVPRDTSAVLRMMDAVESTLSVSSGPTLIHCSAGAGRSGVLLAVAIQQERIDQVGDLDIFNCVNAMRGERPWMVQTIDQYILVHKLLLEWMLCRDTYVRREDFIGYSGTIMELDPETGEMEAASQFKVLNQILPSSNGDQEPKALQPENRKKNRDPNIIPVNRYRPFLMTEITDDPDSTNYINASFLDGISTQSEFLVTQMPLPHTIVDFWRLIHDYQIRTVVMLNSIDKKDPTCLPYWGRDEPLVLGGVFRITMTALDKREDFVARTLVIENLQTKIVQSSSRVRQFQMKRWPNHELRPPSVDQVAGFIRLVRSHLAVSDSEETLLVHCMNGASRSGIFCSALSCINRLEERDAVDVVQTIKHLKQCQPLLIQSEEEFCLVYDIVTSYLALDEDNQMYENIPSHTFGASPSPRGDSDVMYDNRDTNPTHSSATAPKDSHV